MLSTVFQLSTSPIDKDNRLSEESTYENIHNSLMLIDYVEKISDEEVVIAVSNLVNNMFPKDMFEQIDNSSFVYKGGFEEWVKKEYVSKIVMATNTLCYDRLFMTGFGSVNEIERAITNPLNFDCIFIISKGDYFGPALKSGAFMSDFVRDLKPGDKIYVGAVFDYRY